MSTATMLQQFEILERKYRDQGRDLVRVKDELNAEHGEFSTISSVSTTRSPPSRCVRRPELTTPNLDCRLFPA